jgi:hypothetical protein
MPTPGNGAAVHEVAERASTLARLEAELAALEIRQKVSALGAGVVVLGVGLLVALYALGFLFATIAAALQRRVGSRPAVLPPDAFAAGFVISGGVGATLRYFARRGRDRR